MPKFVDYINSPYFVMIEDKLDYYRLTMKANLNVISGKYYTLDNKTIDDSTYQLTFYKTNLHPNY